MQSLTVISERQACALVGVYRSTLRYQSRLPGQADGLSARIVELAQERRRFGYRRIHALLRREGVEVNHKRVYRLYRAAELAVKRRKRRKGVMVPREPLALPTKRNEVWSMDFVMDALVTGRRIKVWTVVDGCAKKAVDLVADFGIPGHYFARILDQVARFRGYPKAVRTDQGPEFTGRALDQWAYLHGVQLKLIQPNKPTQNAFIESFNGKFREECLNELWFHTLEHAGVIINQWRKDYNECRPHSMLGYKTPVEMTEILRNHGGLNQMTTVSNVGGRSP